MAGRIDAAPLSRGKRAAHAGILTNALLAVFKLVVGVVGNSYALIVAPCGGRPTGLASSLDYVRGHGKETSTIADQGQEFDLARPGTSIGTLRRHATHQTASTACRATAGHKRTPTSLAPLPAFARTATATLLYSSIAVTIPPTARFGPSSRASQQAQPNESRAAPAIRATTSPAGAPSDAPSKNATTKVGDTSSIKPVAVSANAVTISSFVATISANR